MGRFCTYCGSQLGGVKFCPNCGAKVEEVVKENNEDEKEIENDNLNRYVNVNGIDVDMDEVIAKYGKDKIEAIKFVSHLTKTSLKESKRIVDEAYGGFSTANMQKQRSQILEKSQIITPKRIVGIIFIIMAAIAIAPGRNDNNAIYYMAGLFIIIGLLLIIPRPKNKPTQVRSIVTDDYINSLITCEYITGLPLAEGTACYIKYEDEKIIISGGGNKFNLDYSRINSMEIKTDVEIKTEYVSSAGGAVAGGILFGTLGALIGGRIKEKQIKITTYYLIITYLRENKIEIICFDITNNLVKFQNKIKEISSKIHKNKREYNL